MRIFDAGVGDGTVLARVMRALHNRFATMPFYIVGKEISVEDVRLALDKMPDRFFEHPATVLIITNLNYLEAPRLTPKSMAAASSAVWHEVALTGTTSHEFDEQITALEPFLAENWRVNVNTATAESSSCLARFKAAVEGTPNGLDPRACFRYEPPRFSYGKWRGNLQ